MGGPLETGVGVGPAQDDWQPEPAFIEALGGRRVHNPVAHLEEVAPELVPEPAPAAPGRALDVARLVRDEVARILGFDPRELPVDQGFFQLGMDSVMSVRLRGRLEEALGRSLPATIALEYPTVEALAAYLLPASAPAEAPAAAASLADEVDRELAALSDLLGRP